MTDLDPIRRPQRENDDLAARGTKVRRPSTESAAHEEMEGPTGRERTTEMVGDPDRSTLESGAESGAGAGMLAGTAVAGPIGLPIGAAAGAAAGGAAEAADEDVATNEETGPLSEPGSEGTGIVDPVTDVTPKRGG